MTDTKEVNHLTILNDLYKEINDNGEAIQNSSPKENKDFWDDVSLLRRKLRDFFTAFGNIDKREKVKNGYMINEITLISTIIE